MITVHHLNNSRSQRVLWLLEELGAPYTVKRYERDAKTMLAPRDLREVHPLGKSPVITDGDHVIAETGAILDYVLERHGNARLVPAPGSDDKLRYTYWMHYAEGSAMTPLLMKLVFTRIPLSTPFPMRGFARGLCNTVIQRMVDPQIKSHATWWEQELGRSAWFAGAEFTAADIMMSFPLEAAAARAGARAYPRVAAFLDAIHARPAYRKALETGGPYDYAT